MTAALLKVGEAALALGVSVETVRRYLDQGILEGCFLPSGHRRITRASVDAIREGVES